MKNKLKTLITRFNESNSSNKQKSGNFNSKGKLMKRKMNNKTQQNLPN
jgi:hypothetical protein